MLHQAFDWNFLSQSEWGWFQTGSFFAASHVAKLGHFAPNDFNHAVSNEHLETFLVNKVASIMAMRLRQGPQSH